MPNVYRRCLYFAWSAAVVAGLSACQQQRPAGQERFAPAPSVRSEPTIESQLSTRDVSVWLEHPSGEAKELPKTIRVRFKNDSDKRGYVDLPGPVRGKPSDEYRTPSLAIKVRQEHESIAAADLIFLYSPGETGRPERATVSILDPDSSVAIEYSLDSFCLIGHGIEPDAAANLLTCFGPGEVPSELQICIVSDWDHFTMTESAPLKLKLSKVDVSKHRNFQEHNEVPQK